MSTHRTGLTDLQLTPQFVGKGVLTQLLALGFDGSHGFLGLVALCFLGFVTGFPALFFVYIPDFLCLPGLEVCLGFFERRMQMIVQVFELMTQFGQAFQLLGGYREGIGLLLQLLAMVFMACVASAYCASAICWAFFCWACCF